MIATFPAVQKNCSRLHRYMTREGHTRRYLNQRTRTLKLDVELFYEEGFDAPSMSAWDID